MAAVDRDRIRNAWLGRISGCQLGKPVEGMSMRDGVGALSRYLAEMGATPLRDYVPWSPALGDAARRSCRGGMDRAEPDDDINYSVLALMLLERHGDALSTADVARAWMRHLPIAAMFTAERAAYRTLADRAHEWFPYGADPGFDLAECSDNPYNDWIGAQIRADVYGWVCPGDPSRAARLAATDASLSHRGDGVWGAVFVAACGAAAATVPLPEAVERAAAEIPPGSGAAGAIELAAEVAGRPDALDRIRDRFGDLSPVHTLNNLALVVWALLTHPDDFGAAVGDVVAAGWDTDCNGATVGGLWGIAGGEVPEQWWEPWQGRVGVTLAGVSEVPVDELVDRTVAVAERLTAGDVPSGP